MSRLVILVPLSIVIVALSFTLSPDEFKWWLAVYALVCIWLMVVDVKQ
jgi:hypothetical protein